MALPKLLQKLFQNGGAGEKLNESIMPYAYARSVNGKYPDSVGNIEIPSRNVGDEWHSFTGQIPVGGVPYCGQEVTRATYADLWAWVQAQGLVKTETEWQALNTSQNGNVPFYSSGDGSTTFRMPKVVGYIKGAASQSESGSYIAEGLPNIVGTLTPTTEKSTDVSSSGAFSHTIQKKQSPYYSHKSTNVAVFDFDASRSNPIYGNSDHVTPETSIVLFGVYAFGEITNVGALDADTLATGLATVESRISELDPLKIVDGSPRWDGKDVERVNSIGTNYVRYENGIQICWGSTGATCSSASGSFYYGISGTYTFPVAFVNAPCVAASATDEATGLAFCAVDSLSNTTITMQCYSTTKGTYIPAAFIAIGFWK